MTARMGQARPLADLTEKEFSAQVAALAKTLGYLRYHTFRSERSPSGFPDEVLVRHRIIYAELKRVKGKPSDEQARWLTALTTGGGECYLLRPGDLQEFAKVLALRCRPWEAKPYWQPASLWLPAGCRTDEQRPPALL